jgi:hypothetical protein
LGATMHRRLRSLPPEPDCIVRIFIRGFCFAIRGIFYLHRPSNTENAHGWHSRTHGSIQLPGGDGYGSTRGGVGFGPNPNRCNKPRRSNPKWANEASRSAVAVASSRFPTNGRLSGMNSIMPAVGFTRYSAAIAPTNRTKAFFKVDFMATWIRRAQRILCELQTFTLASPNVRPTGAEQDSRRRERDAPGSD